MKLKTLTPNLIVKSVNDTLAFYQSTLGFAKVVSVPEEGELDFAIIKLDDVTIMIQSISSINQETDAFKGAGIGGTFTLYINVEGIDSLYSKLKGKAEVVMEMHDTFYGTSEFAIRDNSGYVLAFAESKG